MGEVYRARDTRLKREVAVKVLPGDVANDRDALARFEREARAVAAAQHDIACIYALLGEKDRALDWLTDAARGGFPCYSFFERDAFLESIRGEERFGRLIAELQAECDGYRRLYRDPSCSRHSSGSRNGDMTIAGRCRARIAGIK